MRHKVQWQNDEFQLRAKVFPMGNETREQAWFSIDVYRDTDMLTREWKPAEINWGGYGAQDAETAKAFGEGIVTAAKVAEEMNQPVKTFAVVYTIQEEDGSTRIHETTRVANHIRQIREIVLPEHITLTKIKEVV